MIVLSGVFFFFLKNLFGNHAGMLFEGLDVQIDASKTKLMWNGKLKNERKWKWKGKNDERN